MTLIFKDFDLLFYELGIYFVQNDFLIFLIKKGEKQGERHRKFDEKRCDCF